MATNPLKTEVKTMSTGADTDMITQHVEESSNDNDPHVAANDSGAEIPQKISRSTYVAIFVRELRMINYVRGLGLTSDSSFWGFRSWLPLRVDSSSLEESFPLWARSWGIPRP